MSDREGMSVYSPSVHSEAICVDSLVSALLPATYVRPLLRVSTVVLISHLSAVAEVY